MSSDAKTDHNKLLYFPLSKLSHNESIFQDADKGIFTEKYEPIFAPVLGKQLALNTYYKNDLVAMANTRISIKLLQTFDRLKINFKVNNSDITEEEKNYALYDAMSQIIQSKKEFMDNIQKEDIPIIQSSVHGFLSQALSRGSVSSFQTHFQQIQGYLEFATSVITSDEKYIGTTVALKEMIQSEQKIFRLSKDDIGETIEHSLKTAWLSLILATELDDFDERDYKKLSIICIAHDCGKALIPKEIIYKKGRLSDLESDIMKSHVLLSYILSSSNQQDLKFESFVMALHHIKENRKIPHSYGITPDTFTSFHDYLTPQAQEKLREIHDSTVKFYRLMSIVDTFEAITAERVYKRGSSIGKSIEIMLNENREGNQFYTPYLDTLIEFVIRHFLPKNLFFKISDKILETYYPDNEFNSKNRKFYQRSHSGVVVETSSHLEENIQCVIFNQHTKNIERHLNILPIHLLHNRYFK